MKPQFQITNVASGLFIGLVLFIVIFYFYSDQLYSIYTQLRRLSSH